MLVASIMSVTTIFQRMKYMGIYHYGKTYTVMVTGKARSLLANRHTGHPVLIPRPRQALSCLCGLGSGQLAYGRRFQIILIIMVLTNILKSSFLVRLLIS